MVDCLIDLQSIPQSLLVAHELASITLEYRRECTPSNVVQSLSCLDTPLTMDQSQDDSSLLRNGGLDGSPDVVSCHVYTPKKNKIQNRKSTTLRILTQQQLKQIRKDKSRTEPQIEQTTRGISYLMPVLKFKSLMSSPRIKPISQSHLAIPRIDDQSL